MKPGQRRRSAWLFATIIGAFLALATAVAAAGVLDRSEDPSMSCLPKQSTFGDMITCEVTAPSGSVIDWGDGQQHPAETTAHAPIAVGAVPLTLLDADGELLSQSSVSIRPDLLIECNDEEEPLPVYELVASDSFTGWGYVFIGEDGHRVLPGDADYPTSLVQPNLPRHQIGEGRESGVCQASSSAAAALDGSISWITETDWQPPQRTAASVLLPFSKWDWEGTQPGRIEATVEVMGEIVSERRNVYLSSCG